MTQDTPGAKKRMMVSKDWRLPNTAKSEMGNNTTIQLKDQRTGRYMW